MFDAKTGVLENETEVNRFNIIKLLGFFFERINSRENMLWGLTSLEWSFLVFLSIIALFRLVKMIIYSRAYDILFKGFRGEYGSAFEETDEKVRVKKLHNKAHHYALISESVLIEMKNESMKSKKKTGNPMFSDPLLERLDRANQAQIKEAQDDATKITFSEAIKSIIQQNNNQFTKQIVGLWVAFIFLIKGAGVISNILSTSSDLYLAGYLCMCLHIIIHLFIFISLIFLLFDTNGTIITGILNFLMSIISMGFLSILSPVVNKVVSSIVSTLRNTMIKNAVFAGLGILLHLLVGGLSALLNQRMAPSLEYSGYILNFLLFILISNIYIIIQEADLSAILSILSLKKDYSDSKIRNILNVQCLFLLRLCLYVYIISMCYLILCPTYMPTILGNLLRVFKIGI